MIRDDDERYSRAESIKLRNSKMWDKYFLETESINRSTEMNYPDMKLQNLFSCKEDSVTNFKSILRQGKLEVAWVFSCELFLTSSKRDDRRK